MRRVLATTAIISATLTGLALLAAPAQAADVARRGPGGPGGPGGQGGPVATAPGFNLPSSGTMTAQQKADLASMVEEEKLAHDVYVTLAAKYPSDWQFARIANAETQHQNALRVLLTRYGVGDPTAGEAVGEFSTAAFRSLYAQMIGDATDAASALRVGVAVEQRDIDDLTKALSGLTAPDTQQVYTNLRNASQHHLVAFGG